MTHESQSRTPVLLWQSRLLLAFVLVSVGLGLLCECILSRVALPLLCLQALGFGVLLAALVWKSRAATPSAALTGGLYTSVLYLAAPGWRTALWPLLALLLLTLGATRFGRARKESLGLAEPHQGRNAAQVTANLGVAALAAMALRYSQTFMGPAMLNHQILRLALAAALAEAAADTLSSELGEVLGGEPRLLTTLRRVPAGTDGAISRNGTLAGIIAAIIVTGAAAFGLRLTAAQSGTVILAALAGLFADSLLGATLERRGWLNNDAVNFLSTLAAALLAGFAGAICRIS
jgi:uncharacterized protein (TIGR00297 family)